MLPAVGSRLGSYEITAKLGEGGMGLVFRAKDSQLGREVALKVLPEGFTSDPERLQRFEREAKLLAQLNHPNIAQIYGFETSGETRALVMELVEGPTLAERLEQGPLPFNESLSVSLQIAQALEEAHEKGIVHRDLKPQNIKASIEGRVKVLDFGLAKAMDPIGAASGGSGSASQLARSPTLTLGATVQGMILGTAAYMAPEQARGLGVDKRADIWAFGVVLYEMLAGRRLFEGELVSDVLAGVLRQEVDWGAIPDSVPSAIRSLLRRCLERNPKNRLHDIADARIVLEEVLAGKSEDARAATVPVSVAPPAPRSGWPLVAAVAGALALGIALGALFLRSRSSDERELRFGLALPAGWRMAEGDTPMLALSPDGKRRALVVSSEDHERVLFLGGLGSIDWHEVAGSDGAEAPFFSPDGTWIGFFASGQIKRAPVEGGAVTSVTRVGAQIRAAVWLADGTIVYSPDSSEGLYRVSENGGEPSELTTLDPARKERTHRWPDALPDGSAVLFTSDDSQTSEFYDDANIEAVRVATGERKIVVRGSSEARYLDPGVLVYARGGNLYAIRFDPKSLETKGAAVAVVQGVTTTIASGAVQFATSHDGSLLWIPGQASIFGSEPLWLDLQGNTTPLLTGDRQFTELALSPDGTRLALSTGDSQTSDIWIADIERGSLSRLTFGEGANEPTWSPDGRRVAYNRSGGINSNSNKSLVSSEIYWKSADGSGEPEPLVEGKEPSFAGAFTPDGAAIVYEVAAGASAAPDLWVRPLKDGRGPWQFTKTEFAEFLPAVSPDGRWIAYNSNESGDLEVFLRPFPSGGGRWQVSTGGGLEARWSVDGRSLFYRRGGFLYRVAVEARDGLRLGTPERIAGGARSGENPRTYTPHPDGRRFAILPAWALDRNSVQVALALHWDRDVKRLLEQKR